MRLRASAEGRSAAVTLQTSKLETKSLCDEDLELGNEPSTLHRLLLRTLKAVPKVTRGYLWESLLS